LRSSLWISAGGDPTVVVDDGVDEGLAIDRVVVLLARQVFHRRLVPAALCSADELPPAAVRDVAELLDVHVDKGSRVVVLIAADHFTRSAVDVPQAVQSAADQHRVNRRRRHVQPARDLH
jgi:hypothetical protein